MFKFGNVSDSREGCFGCTKSQYVGRWAVWQRSTFLLDVSWGGCTFWDSLWLSGPKQNNMSGCGLSFIYAALDAVWSRPRLIFHSPIQFLMVVWLSFKQSSGHVCSMLHCLLLSSINSQGSFHFPKHEALDSAPFSPSFFNSACCMSFLFLIVPTGLPLAFTFLIHEISAFFRTTASDIRCRYVSYTSMKKNRSTASLCFVGLRSGGR